MDNSVHPFIAMRNPQHGQARELAAGMAN